jgi:cell division protein ZapE
LREVAAHFAAQARVFCLDEFFVTDIGDAMILAGLLRHLFERGVTLVTTSNIEPGELYRDGLQRAKFLPAIELLRQHCASVELVSAQDYRLRALTSAGVYFTPLGANAERELQACFERLAPGLRRTEPEILVNGRGIAVKRRADGVIWFEFAALCEGPRAVADYIELAQSFNTVLVSEVPQFDASTDDPGRRFVHLIDEFYDRGVNLVLSAAAPITELYRGERLRTEFARTESRLIEMQSEHYLARAHRQ